MGEGFPQIRWRCRPALGSPAACFSPVRGSKVSITGWPKGEFSYLDAMPPGGEPRRSSLCPERPPYMSRLANFAGGWLNEPMK